MGFCPWLLLPPPQPLGPPSFNRHSQWWTRPSMKKKAGLSTVSWSGCQVNNHDLFETWMFSVEFFGASSQLVAGSRPFISHSKNHLEGVPLTIGMLLQVHPLSLTLRPWKPWWLGDYCPFWVSVTFQGRTVSFGDFKVWNLSPVHWLTLFFSKSSSHTSWGLVF